MDRIAMLAHSVATFGDTLQESIGKDHVILAAVLALARTHPDPQALAEEFRRVWTLLGSQHSNAEAGERFLAGIAARLDLLDELLPVAPKVRP